MTAPAAGTCCWSHHEDPIPTCFEPALIVQEPGWLGPADSRPPGISHLACWYPLTTFVLTLMDVKNAMSVTPGRFAARGHDYRADLARMVSQAYGLPATDGELLAIEHALRRREAEWAQRRLVASSCAGPRRPSSGRPGAGARPRTPSPPAAAPPDSGRLAASSPQAGGRARQAGYASASRRRASSSSVTSAAARFSSRCAVEEVPGISRTQGARSSSQAERRPGRGSRPSRPATAEHLRVPEHRVGPGEAGAQREEGHGDPARAALLQNGASSRGPPG